MHTLLFEGPLDGLFMRVPARTSQMVINHLGRWHLYLDPLADPGETTATFVALSDNYPLEEPPVGDDPFGFTYVRDLTRAEAAKVRSQVRQLGGAS